MSPSKTSLDALAAKASKLNAKTDELNGVFESLETKLEAAKVGVSAWLETLLDLENGEPGSESGQGSDEGWTIGYGKVGGKWRLAARRERWPFTMEAAGGWRSGGPVEKNYSDDSIVIDGPVPLVNAPRSVRATAAGMLDELIEALSRKIDVYDENIEKAKTAASMEEKPAPTRPKTLHEVRLAGTPAAGAKATVKG